MAPEAVYRQGASTLDELTVVVQTAEFCGSSNVGAANRNTRSRRILTPRIRTQFLSKQARIAIQEDTCCIATSHLSRCAWVVYFRPLQLVLQWWWANLTVLPRHPGHILLMELVRLAISLKATADHSHRRGFLIA
jgi:hypothetical protein